MGSRAYMSGSTDLQALHKRQPGRPGKSREGSLQASALHRLSPIYNASSLVMERLAAL